jgi:hypothetical protein
MLMEKWSPNDRIARNLIEQHVEIRSLSLENLVKCRMHR